jgi:hypothetical protein
MPAGDDGHAREIPPDHGRRVEKMKLLAAVAVVALAPAAHAAPAYYSETCGSSVLTVGTYSKDRDISVHAAYDNGAWRVVHTLSNGHVYDRGVQYAMSDATVVGADGLVYAKWVGTLRRNPAIMMAGQLAMVGNVPHYLETMVKDGQTIMASDAVCSFDGSSAPVARAAPYEPGHTLNCDSCGAGIAPPAPAPVAPQPVHSGGATQPHVQTITLGVPFTEGVPAVSVATAGLVVPIIADPNGQVVTVALGSIPINMVLDTGASLVSIDSVLADKLIARGEAVEGVGEPSTFADGRTENNRTITINQLTMGGHAIYGVKAFVGGTSAMPLLGTNVLNRFGKFSVDTVGKLLVLG